MGVREVPVPLRVPGGCKSLGMRSGDHLEPGAGPEPLGAIRGLAATTAGKTGKEKKKEKIKRNNSVIFLLLPTGSREAGLAATAVAAASRDEKRKKEQNQKNTPKKPEGRN